MNLRTAVAAVVGAIVLFAVGFLTWGVLLADFMKENTVQYAGLMKDPPDFVPLILHDLVLAWFVAFIFDQWAGIRTVAGGAVGGALVFFAIALATDLAFLAFMDIFKGLAIVAVDVAAATFVGAITGGVIGPILGKMTPEPEAA